MFSTIVKKYTYNRNEEGRAIGISGDICETVYETEKVLGVLKMTDKKMLERAWGYLEDALREGCIKKLYTLMRGDVEQFQKTIMVDEAITSYNGGIPFEKKFIPITTWKDPEKIIKAVKKKLKEGDVFEGKTFEVKGDTHGYTRKTVYEYYVVVRGDNDVINVIKVQDYSGLHSCADGGWDK